MRAPSIPALAREAAGALRAVQGPAPQAVGALGVSGMLADQLARELGRGAEPGAVRVTDSPGSGLAVGVRIVAGDPSDDDRAFVEAGDRAGVPVVLVQLWPQADWTPPFVLSPFVVECRAGEGFPVSEIASRVGEAFAQAPALAARVPVLRESVAAREVRAAVARAALLGLRGRSRPLITLEQLRLTGRLRSVDARAAGGGPTPELAATAGALLASGVALRSLARSARRILPEPMVNPVVAAAGTWAMAEVLRRLDARATD